MLVIKLTVMSSKRKFGKTQDMYVKIVHSTREPRMEELHVEIMDVYQTHKLYFLMEPARIVILILGQ